MTTTRYEVRIIKSSTTYFLQCTVDTIEEAQQAVDCAADFGARAIIIPTTSK